MKRLKDYKEEIHKCSKCGLCQSVCPVYEQTGNDCSVSRGKFIMLNGIIKGDLKLNKNVNKYLDMCLKCNACKNFCPSGIDARKIFLTAKSEYFKHSPEKKLISFLQSKFIFNMSLNLIKVATTIYRALKIDDLAKLFYPILFKMGILGKKVILANEFVGLGNHIKVPKRPPHPSPLPRGRGDARGTLFTSHLPPLTVLYFKGCVNEYINPRAKNAAESVLSKMAVNVLPINFECCGVPFLSGGNVEQFKKQAEFNLSQIPDEFDYFLTDCASCQNAFEEYENYIQDEKLLKKLKMLNEKSLNVVDFILNNIKSVEFNKKTTFTFHKPCHLESMEFVNYFLSKTKNVEYVEMKDFDKCCGFSGEFAVKNMDLSQKISAKKIKNAIFTDTDYILTSCPACLLGLTQGMIEEQSFEKPALNLVEFLALADNILIEE